MGLKVLSNVYYCSSYRCFIYLKQNNERAKRKTLMSSTLGSEAIQTLEHSKVPKKNKNELLHNIHNNAIQQDHNFQVQKKEQL